MNFKNFMGGVVMRKITKFMFRLATISPFTTTLHDGNEKLVKNRSNKHLNVYCSELILQKHTQSFCKNTTNIEVIEQAGRHYFYIFLIYFRSSFTREEQVSPLSNY